MCSAEYSDNQPLHGGSVYWNGDWNVFSSLFDSVRFLFVYKNLTEPVPVYIGRFVVGTVDDFI